LQLSHHSKPFNEKTFPIILVCNNVSNAPNVGSLFRTAEAFGVEKILFCGNEIPKGRKMTKTSRSTEKMVEFQENAEIIECIEQLKLEGYKIYAIEITTNSKALKNFIFPKDLPIAFVIGSENFGVDEDVLSMVDEVIHLEMYGKNSSMNLVQATSITLYELTKQLS